MAILALRAREILDSTGVPSVADQVVLSEIDALSYDSNTHVLAIDFHNGETYQYVAIPCYLYQAFIDADNKEEFFALHIKEAFHSRKADRLIA